MPTAKEKRNKCCEKFHEEGVENGIDFINAVCNCRCHSGNKSTICKGQNPKEEICDVCIEKDCCKSMKHMQVCHRESCDGVPFVHTLHCGTCGEAKRDVKKVDLEAEFIELFCQKSNEDFTRLKAVRIQEPIEYIRKSRQEAVAEERARIVNKIESYWKYIKGKRVDVEVERENIIAIINSNEY